jgi:CBS domain-containing protein
MPETNLATVVSMMWDTDCGIVPVVNQDGHVIGILTDRDISMAVATRGRLASDISVWDACSGQVAMCHVEDDVRDALKTMATRRVRRLPVVNAEGILQGMLSITDLIYHAEEGEEGYTPPISYEDVILTLKAIDGRPAPTRRIKENLCESL